MGTRGLTLTPPAPIPRSTGRCIGAAPLWGVHRAARPTEMDARCSTSGRSLSEFTVPARSTELFFFFPPPVRTDRGRRNAARLERGACWPLTRFAQPAGTSRTSPDAPLGLRANGRHAVLPPALRQSLTPHDSTGGRNYTYAYYGSQARRAAAPTLQPSRPWTRSATKIYYRYWLRTPRTARLDPAAAPPPRRRCGPKTFKLPATSLGAHWRRTRSPAPRLSPCQPAHLPCRSVPQSCRVSSHLEFSFPRRA